MQLKQLFTAKKTITLSVAAALLGSWSVNAAQQETQAEENIEQISVIGSRRLGRTVEDSPVPIDIISGDALNYSGFTFAPNVTYFRNFDWSGTAWRAGVALGPQFGSKDYQNLYYGVDDAFATDTRPSYSADSGYAGSRLLMTLRSQNRERLWVWFVRYENISGATFDDSPLVETNNGLSIGLIFSKFLFKSKQTVRRKVKPIK